MTSPILKNYPEQRFQRLSLLFFFCLGLVGILNHAMWRDELNGWLIARDSQSLGDFWGNVKYEGHPLLWYLCLALLNQLTHNPVAMQVFHLLVATGAAALFICFSPFTRWQRTLFIFGYLPIYEYLSISRNYAIGMFTCFLFCTVYEGRKKSYLGLSAILALMANTNAYCLLIAVALGLTLAVDYRWDSRRTRERNASLRDILLSLSIFAVGSIISVATLIPPADSTLQGGVNQWMFQLDFPRLAQAITRIWNSYILVLVPGDSRPLDVSLFAILSLGLFGFVLTWLIRKPVALGFYTIATAEIVLFTYLKFLGSPRHYGHLYIILIISLWLASYYKESDFLVNLIFKISGKRQKIFEGWIRFVSQYKSTFFTVILSAQLVAGIVSFSRDLMVPYSASRETAHYIKTHQLDSLFILGSEDFAVSPLSGYLNRKIYYPEIQKLGSFVLFNSQRKAVDTAEILEQARQLSQEKKDILMVLNSEIDPLDATSGVTQLAKFTKGLIYNEKYYLYLMKPHP